MKRQLQLLWSKRFPPAGAIELHKALQYILGSEIWLYDGSGARRLEPWELARIDLDSSDLRLRTGSEHQAVDERVMDRALLKILKVYVRDVCGKTPPESGRKQPALQHPPGYRLSHWLRFLVGAKAYERFFEQPHADHLEEWQQAHHANRLVEAKWIKVRCVLVLCWCLVAQLPLEKVYKLLFGGGQRGKADRGDR